MVVDMGGSVEQTETLQVFPSTSGDHSSYSIPGILGQKTKSIGFKFSIRKLRTETGLNNLLGPL